MTPLELFLAFTVQMAVIVDPLAGVPLFLGITPPEQVGKAAANHSPRFYVDEPALVTGVRALAHLTADYLFSGKDVSPAPAPRQTGTEPDWRDGRTSAGNSRRLNPLANQAS